MKIITPHPHYVPTLIASSCLRDLENQFNQTKTVLRKSDNIQASFWLLAWLMDFAACWLSRHTLCKQYENNSVGVWIEWPHRCVYLLQSLVDGTIWEGSVGIALFEEYVTGSEFWGFKSSCPLPDPCACRSNATSQLLLQFSACLLGCLPLGW